MRQTMSAQKMRTKIRFYLQGFITNDVIDIVDIKENAVVEYAGD